MVEFQCYCSDLIAKFKVIASFQTFSVVKINSDNCKYVRFLMISNYKMTL